MRKIVLSIGAVVVVALLGLQFIPVVRDNPPVTREVKWESPETRALAQRACFDCHSNETVWPWYSQVAPVSFLLSRHVQEGREHLNFSTWDQPNHDFEEVERNITNGSMPPWDYLLMHPTANLSQAEKTQLLNGLQATFQQDPPIEAEER